MNCGCRIDVNSPGLVNALLREDGSRIIHCERHSEANVARLEAQCADADNACGRAAVAALSARADLDALLEAAEEVETLPHSYSRKKLRAAIERTRRGRT
jgi:hypothetical protein